ncbi:MAG: tripartite tricarboxylate transporter substrate binding protein [Burkholderiales bacterium]
MRAFVQAVALMATTIVAVPSALGQATDYPNRPIRFVVPFPPGGAADTFARLASHRLGEVWKQQNVVENRPGAGGIIATEFAVKAPPDGYTFLVVTVGHAVNPSLYAKLPYDTLNDLAGVAMIASVPNVLTVHPSVPANTVQELIALAKSKPGGLTYASSGNATTSHMAAALLAQLAGVTMTHVPYKGAAPAVQDLVAGRIDLMLDPTVSSGGFVKQGKLRALAVTTARRTPLLPDLPTLAEAGVPGYEFSAWFLMVAPAKTPVDILVKVNLEIARMNADPQAKERFAALGAEPAPHLSSAAVNTFIDAEIKRWAKVVREANIRVE